MPYNLIDERWIPVERRSGKVEYIAPAQIVERDDPPMRIASPRPDFDGALLEFLIGLVQTAAAPSTEREWEHQWEAPPSVEALQKGFAKVRDAFNLDGDGPRFMQDLEVHKNPKAQREPIGALLIDRIGESGLEEAPSLFAKPGRCEALGYPAAAAALMALQTYAPAGGRGQLTSLRGGGPLTTVITAGGLWPTIWLNVLPAREFEREVPGDSTKDLEGGVFPWMRPTRTSEARVGRATAPMHVHPLQQFWGLPRRVRLDFDPVDLGVCAVTGEPEAPVVRGYCARPDGTSYEGDFRHPLTPYTLVESGEPWNSKKGSADGLPYREWPLLVAGTAKQRPAIVVSYFARTRRREIVPTARLTAFGYAMKNMKPLQWCRAETPIVTVAEEKAADFAGVAESLVLVSDEARKSLSAQVRSAWSDRPADLDVFSQVNPAFWSATELAFYGTLHAGKSTLETGDTAGLDRAKSSWLTDLHRAALGLFDRFVKPTVDLAPPDLRRALEARRDLEWFTHPTSPKLRKLLALPVEEGNGLARNAKGRSKKKENTP